jgi:SAM-dependent methyltransferase
LGVFQQRAYLRENQYRRSDHLTARANLHARFNVSEQPWPEWALTQIALQPGDRILECGGGPGWLWEQAGSLPPNSGLVLTDLSDGMVAEAAAALAHYGAQAGTATADIQTLPFPDHTFDVVIANHMLYHVPDIPAAVHEAARVLRPGGLFVAATNGRDHMRELFELGADVFPEAPLSMRVAIRSLPFSLENGADFLASSFPIVERRLYDSHLAVDDAAALVDYMLSSAEAQAAVPEARRTAGIAAIEARIQAEGPVRISKETGLFIARAPVFTA